MKNLLVLASTVGGQAVWALAQAAVIVLLSARGEHALIGVYVVGLAVFAPLCLLGGLNLRTSIALGRNTDFASAKEVLGLRLSVVALAIIFTSIVLVFAAPTNQVWGVALLLVALRAVDQISDVAIGFYQRDDRQDLIARSFFLRGAANILPFLTVMLIAKSFLLASAVTLVSTFVVAFWHDIDPILRKPSLEPSKTVKRSRLFAIVKGSALVAPYPVLDNLHVNSFRYAMFLGTSPEVMGLVGVAQTLFVPFQLVSTAIGFRFLPLASRAYKSGKQSAVFLQALTGVGMGFCITLTFLAFSWFIPTPLLEILFHDKAAYAAPILLIVSAAMIPITATGFAALSLVACNAQRIYSLAPAIALVVFWLCAGCFFALVSLAPGIIDRLSPEVAVAAIFFFSAIVRLLFALVGIANHTPRIPSLEN